MMESMSCMEGVRLAMQSGVDVLPFYVIHDVRTCPATACEALMTTKPSERIVVFVTPAQKLAISNTAASLGISASELMRRAVMSFDVTSEQVKVAGIVDRLHAPRAPDPLNVALRQVAERAAAREAREAAQLAKTTSKRTALEDLSAEPEPDPLASPDEAPAIPELAADQSDHAALAAQASEENAPDLRDQPVAATRTAATVPAADASALAKQPQAMSMKTSISLHPFSVARFVKS